MLSGHFKFSMTMLEILISFFPNYSSSSICHWSKQYHHSPNGKKQIWESSVITRVCSGLPDPSSEAHNVIYDYKLKCQALTSSTPKVFQMCSLLSSLTVILLTQTLVLNLSITIPLSHSFFTQKLRIC